MPNVRGRSDGSTERPRSLILISSVFVAAGAIGLAYHSTEFNAREPFHYDVLAVLLLRVLAIVAGVFMFRGANWARWLALAWLGYHVILSAFHSWSETVIHAVLLAAIGFALFRPKVSAYFHLTPSADSAQGSSTTSRTCL
jgi:asparagine N-glycosylation enzyme membrane subunit Stt3